MSAGPGVAPANSAKFRLIVAKAAVSTLICSRLGGRPPAAAGAAAAAVLVPGMTAPVIRARRGSDGGTGRRAGGPVAPVWADGSNNAAISAAAVIGNVRVSSALRMYLLLRASLGRRLVAAGRLHPAWARPGRLSVAGKRQPAPVVIYMPNDWRGMTDTRDLSLATAGTGSPPRRRGQVAAHRQREPDSQPDDGAGFRRAARAGVGRCQPQHPRHEQPQQQAQRSAVADTGRDQRHGTRQTPARRAFAPPGRGQRVRVLGG